MAGLTGVGKSRFVENELNDRVKFYGENAMLDWILADENDKPTLFLDEANLSSRQWSEFEGLYQYPPGLLYQGKHYTVSSSHKVIFAGNPLSYGDERKLAPPFMRHGNSLIFQPLSPAVLYESVLKPLLEPVFCRFDTVCIAESLLAVYQFLVEISSRDVLISPRQLQMMALAVIDYAERFPHASKIVIAQFHARNISIKLVPKQFLARFEEKFPEIYRDVLINRSDEPILLNGFLTTPSRQRALWQLTDFLSLRNYQRRTHVDDIPAKRFGGLHRFVIEGEPGIGKSELVLQVLASQGIYEASLYGDCRQDNSFYRLSATMQPDMQTAILFRAFDTGSIVLIDEINSIPTLEQLLNSLLDGKHPKEANRSPQQPGFRIIGTQNPPSLAGRRHASPALENRTQLIILEPYTKLEMDEIAYKFGFLCSVIRNELINAFHDKSLEAKRKHLIPPPSFRDFIRVLKTVIIAEQKKQQEHDAFLNEKIAPDLSIGQFLDMDDDDRDDIINYYSVGLFEQLNEFRLNRLIEMGVHREKSLAFLLAYSDSGIRLLAANCDRFIHMIYPSTLNHIITSGPFEGTSVAFFIANAPEGYGYTLLSASNHKLASQINHETLNTRGGIETNYSGLSAGECLANSLKGREILYAEQARLFNLLDPDFKNSLCKNSSFSLSTLLYYRLKKRPLSEVSNQDELPATDQHQVKRLLR